MNEGLILALVFTVLLLGGVPIVFAIGLASFLAILASLDAPAAAAVVAQRLATGLDNFALLAIPFFILSGNLMNRGGIAARLVELAKVVVGPLPGGLAYVNVLANVLFGAISGSAVAAAAANGGFMGPLMRKEGYDRAFGAAVNVSSSVTGLLIPPSNVMVVYSLASGGVSISALFVAGYVPGILLGLVLMVIGGVIAKREGYPVGERVSLKRAWETFLGALPSLALIFLVMGGIIGGLFTPTEASAVAVLYTLVLSVAVYREVSWRELPRILVDSASTTAIVLLLIGTSMALSWVMSSANLPQMASEALLGISQNPVVLLLVMNLVLLLVGTFMDMTPAVLIFTPIFLPVAVGFGMDPVHFGLMMVFNLCVGLCTPPVGSVLFIGCGVSGSPIGAVVRRLVPFFVGMVAVLVLVTAVPGLSLGLPRLLGLR
jgi:tripartite ATP-independent transporter DctM subunit